jgi:subfamily B ATP-binding cassette protein MsbA
VGAALPAAVTEGLSGIRLARAYRLEEPLAASAAGVFERLVGLRIQQNRWQARVAPMMEILIGIAVAILLFMVGVRIRAGTITIADFTALLTGLGVISGPARRLGGNFATVQQGAAALERVFGLFDTENTIVDGPEVIGRAIGQIRFEDVGFAYPDGHVALEGFGLAIEPGMRVAFVGRSGAGKSTVFNLLPRLYDPTAGRILLDGHDLRSLTLASLRDQIAVVNQESVLLTGTVAGNIGFGRRAAGRAEIEAAARAAAADGFIRALPQGYDTPVAPTAGQFSGGERQRLSIARAILRDAPVLLLDEPTSALDAESEAAIRDALERLARGRTTLVIAHRLSTVLDADLIVVMDRGRIVEEGTHAELLARRGLYADLYRLQFAGAEG